MSTGVRCIPYSALDKASVFIVLHSVCQGPIGPPGPPGTSLNLTLVQLKVRMAAHCVVYSFMANVISSVNINPLYFLKNISGAHVHVRQTQLCPGAVSAGVPSE